MMCHSYIAPAKIPLKNWVKLHICLASTHALLAGELVDIIEGTFLIPYFFIYSGECPEQL